MTSSRLKHEVDLSFAKLSSIPSLINSCPPQSNIEYAIPSRLYSNTISVTTYSKSLQEH